MNRLFSLAKAIPQGSRRSSRPAQPVSSPNTGSRAGRTGATRFAALGIALLTAACAPPPAPPQPDSETLRRLSGGQLIGFQNEQAMVWRGIPYATAPVGPLRWRSPQPPPPWEGTRPAIDFGAACAQLEAGTSTEDLSTIEVGQEGDEDCLSLNIYAPKNLGAKENQQSLKPVLVWIHGGGNSMGDARFYDGSSLATEQDVVVVTVQYRLGVFGWFDHPALHGPDASPDDRSGNYGTLDLIRALEWIESNIAQFGGDPNRITIFGESAGGADVLALLASPRAKGLFHRAIAQSGSTRTVSRAQARNAQHEAEPGLRNSSTELLLALLINDGQAANRIEAGRVLEAMQQADIEKFLRSRSSLELLGAVSGGSFGGMYDAPELIRDGHVLPQEGILEALRTGRANPVPVMLGTNRDETKLFSAPSSPWITRLGPIPLWFNNQAQYDLEADYGSRLWKVRGADAPAQALAESGQAPVWVYRFDWDEEGSFLWLDFSELIGAGHGVEIPFVFGNFDFGPFTDTLFPEPSRDAAQALSRQMMSYWGSFARSGNPNPETAKRPDWPAWQNDRTQFLRFDTPAGGGVSPSGDTASVDQILNKIAKDPRIQSDDLRCRVYAQMTQRGGPLSAEEYTRIADGLCQNRPLEDAL